MKSLIIATVVGLICMGGGFFLALRLKPLPVPVVKSPTPVAATDATATPPHPDTISVDTLRRTSETMMALNEALFRVPRPYREGTYPVGEEERGKR